MSLRSATREKHYTAFAHPLLAVVGAKPFSLPCSWIMEETIEAM